MFIYFSCGCEVLGWDAFVIKDILAFTWYTEFGGGICLFRLFCFPLMTEDQTQDLTLSS